MENSWLLNHLNVLLQVPGASRFHLFIAAETFAQVSCANPKVGTGFYCITDLQNSSCVSGSIAIAFCTLMKKVINIILFILDFYQSSKSFRKAGDSHSCVIKHRRNCKQIKNKCISSDVLLLHSALWKDKYSETDRLEVF